MIKKMDKEFLSIKMQIITKFKLLYERENGKMTKKTVKENLIL